MSGSESDIKIVNTISNNHLLMACYEGNYFFIDNTNDRRQIIETPKGNFVRTAYRELADRILSDLADYGTECMSSESILPWHYTMIDSFAPMKHSEVVKILDEDFLQKPDWTLDLGVEDEEWKQVFGLSDIRKSEIRQWLSKCTHMQMTAACCIGNAYYSINVAYVIARLMENFSGKERKKQFKLLAEMIDQNTMYGPVDAIKTDFAAFELYYGIHLKENGPIINQPMIVLREDTGEYSFNITKESLTGRNFYHYTDGVRDNPQPICLKHDLSDIEDSDEYSDNMETEQDGEQEEINHDRLSLHLSDDCWVKRINAGEEDQEKYYIICLETDQGYVSGITVLLDEVSRLGNIFFYNPGMQLPEYHSYEELEEYPDIVKEELHALKSVRILRNNFSFIGKKLPQRLLDEGSNDDDGMEYTYALRSAYRLAYMNMYITTDEDGIIEDFDYSTYSSTGSSYGDMVTRPQKTDCRHDEIIDMLLFIMDQYTDEEYEEYVCIF